MTNLNVFSEKFGKGVIIEILEGKATVIFEKETKTLILKFAGLTYENGDNVYIKEDLVNEDKKIIVTKKKTTKKEVLATVSDLKDLKNLIIYYINKASYSLSNVSLNKVMTVLLNDVNKGVVSAKTKRGIKGAITRRATSIALSVSEENLRENNGFSILENTNGNSILEKFESFRLNVLMGK